MINIIKQDNFYIIDGLDPYVIIDLAQENQVNQNFEYFLNAIDIIKDNQFKIHQFFIFELYILLKYAKLYNEAIFLYENSHLKNLGKIKQMPKNDLSKIIKYEPKAYQKTFIEQYPILKTQLDLRGYYLAFDTGLGKSFTSFTTAFTYGDRLIVVSPKSLKINWKNEILQFSNFNEEDICIFPEEEYTNQKVVLTNYEQVKNLPIVFDKHTFIILDEAQQNRYADRVKIINLYKFIIQNHIDNVLVLSGTPVKGRYGELSGAFLLLDKYFDLDALPYFYKVYNKISSIGSTLLKHRLSLTMLRLTKEKAGKFVSLPPKTLIVENVILDNMEKYIITKEKVFDLIMKCSTINKEFVSDLEKLLDKNKEFNNSNIKHTLDNLKNNNINFKELVLLKKLKKIIDKDFLVKDKSCIAKTLVNNYNEILRDMILHIYKNKMDFIKNLFKKEKKILVFTMYVSIAEELARLFKENITENVFVIHGGKSLEERKLAIEKFKTEDTILVATYGALGYGVTLVEGRIVLYADLPYREADLKQAVDRVYRIGQTREVFVYYLKLMAENTIQEKREKIIEKYAEFVKSLIDEDFEYILEKEFQRFSI